MYTSQAAKPEKEAYFAWKSVYIALTWKSLNLP